MLRIYPNAPLFTQQMTTECLVCFDETTGLTCAHGSSLCGLLKKDLCLGNWLRQPETIMLSETHLTCFCGGAGGIDITLIQKLFVKSVGNCVFQIIFFSLCSSLFFLIFFSLSSDGDERP